MNDIESLKIANQIMMTFGISVHKPVSENDWDDIRLNISLELLKAYQRGVKDGKEDR